MRNQSGYLNPLGIPLAVLAVLTVVFGGAAIWAYGQFTNQRDNTDALVAEAVATAEATQAATLEAQFAEELKSPYETYTAPSAFNSVAVTYPRSWSAYVIESSNGRTPLDGYIHPNYVPDVRSDTNFALRFTLETTDYADEVESYQRSVDDGTIKASGVTINTIDGVRLDGAIERDTNGALVLLPIRDKVLKIWTESTAYLNDFNSIILENLTFDP
jgi:hypothetical protein